MCNDKNFDSIAIVISVLLSIGITILAFLGLITNIALAPIIIISFSAFSLLALTLASISLLRQDKDVNKCICKKGKKLLLAAVASLILSSIGIITTITNTILFVVLVFLTATFFIYQLFSFYCFLYCLINQGCKSECPNKCDNK